MDDGSDELSAVALVGMGGFAVTGHLLRDAEHSLAVETTASCAWCAGCGVGNGRRQICVWDLPITGPRGPQPAVAA